MTVKVGAGGPRMTVVIVGWVSWFYRLAHAELSAARPLTGNHLVLKQLNRHVSIFVLAGSRDYPIGVLSD